MKILRHLGLLFFVVSLLLIPHEGRAATLFLSPSSGSFGVGDSISVKVGAKSDVPLNAVSSSLNFSTDTLTLQSISKSSSILTFWATEPSFSNTPGVASFEGVSLGKSYTGSFGVVVTLNFRARAEGPANISFTAGSVLANDGKGTNILTDLQNADFTIHAKAPAAPEVPAPKKPRAPEETVEPIATTSVAISDAPVITLAIEGVMGKKIPVVHGLTKYSEALLTLTISSEADALRVSAHSGPDGSFAVPIPDVLKSGLYTLSATVTRPDGSESAVSNELTLNLTSSGGGIFENVLPYAGLLLFFVAILGLFFVLLWYGSLRLLKTHHRLGRETREAELTLHKSFKLLQHDLVEHLRGLKRAKNARSLTSEEESFLEQFGENLSEAETIIASEMRGQEKSN